MKSCALYPVSYTHLRAHETDTSLFVGSVRCGIRDRFIVVFLCPPRTCTGWISVNVLSCNESLNEVVCAISCLLYTSPSPRDGHLSIRRQRQMWYKRQVYSRFSVSTSYLYGVDFS